MVKLPWPNGKWQLLKTFTSMHTRETQGPGDSAVGIVTKLRTRHPTNCGSVGGRDVLHIGNRTGEVAGAWSLPLTPSIAEVKQQWSFAFTSQYEFMARRREKYILLYFLQREIGTPFKSWLWSQDKHQPKLWREEKKEEKKKKKRKQYKLRSF